MKLLVSGGGQVNLSKRDFIGSGGEGSVYVKGDTAYKIYANSANMITTGKIDELKCINDPNVIKPLQVLRNSKKKPVGYTMRYVAGGVPICQFFTKAFKKRNGVEPGDVLDVVRNMQDGLGSIHAANVLVVDLNEMNLLVKDGKVCWIDVDSYQTEHYPATAIMDSIRDRHAGGKWSRETDWFSWGIVTFQLFMGIHPYKGKHPKVKGLSDRMRGNLSVFNSSVQVPKMVPDLSVIPASYRKWYRAVFEQGKRVPPPSDVGVVFMQMVPRQIASTDQLEVKELLEFDHEVIRYERAWNYDMAVTTSGAVCQTNGRGAPRPIPGDGHLGYTNAPKALYARMQGGEAVVHNLHSGVSIGRVPAHALMSYAGRFYCHYNDHISEIVVQDSPNAGRCWVTTRLSSNVMERATQLFEGVAIQNMLGSCYASVFPYSGISIQTHLIKLDGYKIVDAKYDHGVLIAVGVKNGKYDKFVYRYDVDHTQATLFWVDQDITYSGINFVVLDNGTCAHIDEEEDLVLFSSSLKNVDVKRIKDPVLGGDMRLFKSGGNVVFAKGKKIFKLSTRK